MPSPPRSARRNVSFTGMPPEDVVATSPAGLAGGVAPGIAAPSNVSRRSLLVCGAEPGGEEREQRVVEARISRVAVGELAPLRESRRRQGRLLLPGDAVPVHAVAVPDRPLGGSETRSLQHAIPEELVCQEAELVERDPPAGSSVGRILAAGLRDDLFHGRHLRQPRFCGARRAREDEQTGTEGDREGPGTDAGNGVRRPSAHPLSLLLPAARRPRYGRDWANGGTLLRPDLRVCGQ